MPGAFAGFVVADDFDWCDCLTGIAAGAAGAVVLGCDGLGDGSDGDDWGSGVAATVGRVIGPANQSK